MPHNSVKTNILKLITLRFALVAVMLCAFSGAAFAQFTATFKNYNGTVLQTVKVKRGTAPKYTGATPTRPADAQYTYTFKGWSPTVGVITKNTTYTAQFTATVRKYTITFLNGDGSTLQSSSVAYGSTPSCSSTPTKAATAQYTYTFKAWSPAIAKVTGAATYTPTFNQTVRSYAIKFVDGDGKTVQSSTLQYGATPSYTGSTPTKTATAQYTYTFKAWSPTIAKVTGAATYTATFNQTVRSYTITFKNGSTTLQSKSFNYGATPTYSGSKPTKAPSGEDTFVFTGWTPAITKVTGAKTYSAVFAKGTYDACGNAYTYVKIGNQTWLTENMRCNKYDTNSERAGATISTSTPADKNYTPYYKLVSDKSLWSKYQFEHCADAMSDTQLTSAGYLYNWAAAVGVATVSDAQSDAAFGTPRQGICPNGWHIPIIEEFITLKDFVGTNSADKLRTVNGWCNDDYRYQDGLDTFGFAGLGAGYFSDEHEIVCFDMSYFWSASSDENRKDPYAQALQLWTIYRDVSIIKRYANAGEKYKGYSVRCMKGPQYTIKFVNYDGTVLQSLKVTESYTPSYTGATPTRARTAQYTYTFKGWDSTISTATENKTYTATYTSTTNSYTIRFLNGTSVLQSRNMAYGITPTYTGSTPTKAATAEYSYTFSGWSPAIASVSKAQDYTAQFTESKRKYTIKFANYDGTVLQSEELEYGVTPTYKSSTPTRPDDVLCANYVFTGWSPSISSVTGSVTYKALFTGESKTYDAPENSHSIIKIPDICGNKYNVVKIGSQLWLAENMRCNKYDTESERAGAVIPTIPSGSSNNPYYEVYPAGNNETNWNNQLLASQIPYLGTFFSWAAAVGFASGTEAVAQTTSFENRRQGICPNGWHLPTTDEWHVLVDFIELTDGKGEGTAGKHMKTITGWYNNKNGLDTYGFSALPADRAISNKTFGVGGWGKWWTSDAISGANVSTVQVYHGGDDFMFGANEIKSKSTALCVRCVKNPEKFEIKFVNYDGSELQSTEVEYGSLPEYKGDTPVKEADAQYTYTFSGWSPEVAVVTEAATYTAQYDNEVNKYVIRFLDEDGTELQSSEFDYGATPAYTGETPIKEATVQYTYTFAGWDSEIAEVTGAKDYTATYTPTTNKYVVRFLNEDGTELQSSELEYGATPIYDGDIPTKDATVQYTYTFAGWDSEIADVSGAKDYTATYTPSTNKYVVRFLNEDGTELQSEELEYGTTPAYTGETPTKDATAQYTYTFNGWDSDIEAVTGAKDYRATYTSTTNKYLITFENYDGEELQSGEVEYGQTPAYTGATPEKPADAEFTYYFSGWSPDIAPVTGTQTYTAQFDDPTTNKYVVRFLNEDGTELQSEELEYGTTPEYTGETPTKEATAQYTYTFNGWDSEIAEVTGAKDYTATYSPTTNKYVVRFLNEDGTELQSEELEYGTTPEYTGETPTKEATVQYTYTFNGWDNDIEAVTGAKDYTATYTPITNKYVVRFLNEDGTELQSEELAYGATPEYKGETPTKDATAQYTYTFAGWDSEIAAVTGAKDYRATYTSTTNKYLITFENYDGEELQSDEVEYGVTPTYSGEAPEKPADAENTYVFTGWSPSIESVTKAQTYTAQFSGTTNKYLIRFLNEDGTELQSEELAYGATPEYKGETPTKDATAQYTYTFAGWDSEIAAVTGAKDYTATYTPTTNKYVVRFLNDDGTELQSSELEYGVTPAYTGETPTKEATAQYTYTFAGWNSEIAEVTGAKDYTATYTPTTNKYTVRFLNEDGEELQSEELEYGATPAYTGETPTKEATAQYTYTFNGWDSEIAEVTGAKDYTATYTPTTNKYLITFENYDGEVLQSSDVEYGQSPTYTGATPVKPADAENTYVFNGWSPEITTVTAAQTYTAQYRNTTNTYIIRFLNDDGTELQSEELEYGVTPAYTGETPTKDATAQYTYTFNGWDSDIEAVTGAKDYTATYAPTTNKYLITFENYNGEELQSGEVEYGQTPAYTGATPEKPADAENTYVFTGWSPEITSVTSAQAYTAQYRNTTNTYIIRFLNEDGTELQSEELEYGVTPAYTGETPTKEATAQYTYTFNGWDSEIAEVTGAKDYTAIYTPTTNKYLITFENYNGEELQSGEVEYGTTPTYSGEAPEKPADAENTYTFTGWSPSIESVTKAQIYTAQFSSTTNKYIIRFLNEDGTELQTEELAYGATPAYTGETPTKEATAQYTYTFNGWDAEIAEVTGAKDYTATYTPTTNKYVVRFLNEDGTELQSEELEYGATPAYTGETPTKQATAQYSYRFNGWDSEIEAVTGAKDYTATYTPTTNKYVVRFLNEDGTELQSEELDYGATPAYTGETPTKEATAQYTYTFAGWDSEIAEVTGAKDYIATYTPTTNKYTVRFLNEDGTELQKEELDYGATPAYTGETPTKDATAQYTYTFNGWDSEIAEVTGAKDYTATYTPTTNKYTVRFLNDDGTELQSEELEYGVTPAYTGETPIKDATAQYTYTFAGWDSEIAEVTGAKDYTATYSPTTNKYVIRFLNEDGTELQSEELEYGTTPAYTGEAPTKEATAQYTYTFARWDSEIAEVSGTKDYTATYTSTVNKYTIVFKNYNGEELQSVEVEYGQTPTYTGATPEKPADKDFTYTFEGWIPEITTVTAGQTCTAQFSRLVKSSDAPENSHSIEIVTDICGNKYNVVKIGSQLWLAENMRCNKYDTESEKAGQSFSTSSSAIYAPYYTGCFTEGANVTISPNNTFTDEQWDYLGLLYNWAAALGLSEGESRAQTREFKAPRQGICPNGYHVPSDAEWLQLIDYIENTDGKGEGTAAKHLKATSGWAPNSNNGNGLDTYGFSLLPVDRGVGKTIYGIGTFAKFTTASAKSNTFADYMNVDGDALVIVGNVGYASAKSHIYTVRCVREAEKFEIKFVNYDGSELQSTEVEYGSLPEYTGETPAKDATSQYTYTFSGWSPDVIMVTEAATYTAQFSSSVNKYVVRFLNEDGEELQSEELEYGVTPAYTGETPTKDATAQYTYTFAGWDSEIETVTGAKDYTATYAPTTNKYVVRFLNEDGIELQSEELAYGATPAYTGETPTKDATAQYTYTFAGWDSEITEVTGAKDYTATYTPTTNKYVVRFLNEDGTVLQSEELDYGATPAYTGETPTKDATAQYTYTFNGWDPEIAEVTGAKDYTATYTPTTNKYVVRFLNEDGTELQSDELAYGATPAYTGETPTKDATAQYTYTFNGWDSEIVEVTGAKDYTATYTPTTNKYTVRFLNEDGEELQSEELEYGTTPAYTGETPTKEATAQYTYTFNGWDSEIAEVAGAKDYTATYTPTTNKYLITFENYDGEELQSGEVEYGQAPAYTGATPEKPADIEFTYTFSGWSPDIIAVTEATTYTAQFSSSVNKYVVRFLNDDGTELQSEELAFGAIPAYNGTTPAKDATDQYTYTFAGWDSDIETVTGAKDYTATYAPTTNKYLITFENYDGEVLQSSDVEYGQTPSYTGATPVKPADAESTYTFSGWSPNITAVTGAQTYTAVFTKVLNTYTVTAEVTGDGGTVSGGGTYSYGTEVTLTATPEHGYHVSKWSTGETSAEIKITVTEDMAFTVSFIHQTADNTPECANAPAVAKYDWLLMLNANALKDKGYNLNENIVDWYRVVGEMDNLDSGERDDEKVGSGYYYTINSKLNDSGDYYALIDLPWQTTEVGCSGLMRTVVFHYAPKGSTKRAMAVSPTITYPEQEIEVRNLPQEVVEVYVYDVAGRLYRSFRTNGETTAAFNAEPMAGTYIVVVWTSKGKETFKYIVRKR